MTNAEQPAAAGSPARKPRRRRLAAALAVCVIGVVVVVVMLQSDRLPSVDDTLREAQSAYNRGEYPRAEALAQSALDRQPDLTDALYLVANALVAQRKDEAALEFLLRVPDDGSQRFLDAFRTGAKLAMSTGRARQAETFLRGILKHRPDSLDANNQLAYLLGMEGRAWEARRYLLNVVRLGRPTVHHLVMLSAGEPVIQDAMLLKRFQQATPKDPLALLGPARTMMFAGKQEKGIRQLAAIVRADPRIIEAQAQLGLAYANTNNPDFVVWNRRLPDTADAHPDVWVARGIYAAARRETRTAVRCFLEVVKRDPNNRVACYRLVGLLKEVDEQEAAARFEARAALLRKLTGVADRIFVAPNDTDQMRDAMRLTESLGRVDESLAWASAARRAQPGLPWVSAAFARLDAQAHNRGSDREASASLVAGINPKKFPLPEWAENTPPPDEPVVRAKANREPPAISFVDDAAGTGLSFQYHNGSQPGAKGSWIVQSMGGGVAVLDFDADGRPDVYFTQGADWPVNLKSSAHVDRLFQNTSDGRFVDVTRDAGLGDVAYSHGCSVGDFDGDGFADLYVANAGLNRLYHNNGDGTFSDVTEEAGLTSRKWTTSCLIADVTGDGLPDLYDVNYLRVDLARLPYCRRGQEASEFGPAKFAGETDRLYVNLGDGRFQDMTAAAGIDRPHGKGLGIVAANLFDTGRIDLFVSNDTTPNFLFRRQSSDGQPLKFREVALATGVAVDGEGLAQACMGVAVGDANGDGRLDLFVTNYANQSNTLYLRDDAGFTDATRSAGLRGPSFESLGFGTQFLDADLDGRLDLVLTNGHVYEPRAEMAPQLFHNRAAGRFVELKSQTLGPFFKRKSVGRGLARLDWNGDGRPDFVVTHTNSPAALLTNRSPRAGGFLTVLLRGTRSGRDAIGANVTIEAGGRRLRRQLTAGDGYQAGNQRALFFGLGTAKHIDRLTVRWRTGTKSEFRDVPINQRVLSIEGRNTLLRLP